MQKNFIANRILPQLENKKLRSEGLALTEDEKSLINAWMTRNQDADGKLVPSEVCGYFNSMIMTTTTTTMHMQGTAHGDPM